MATHQFIGLAKKAFQMQGLCILAHDMDMKGDYIIYTLQGSDWSRRYIDPLHVTSFDANNFLSAMLEDKLTVTIALLHCA